MKTCLYCGGNNNDSANICVICGRDMHTGDRTVKVRDKRLSASWTLPRPESPYASLFLLGPILAFFLLGLAVFFGETVDWFYDLALPKVSHVGGIGGFLVFSSIALAGVMLFRLFNLMAINKGYYLLLQNDESGEARGYVRKYNAYSVRAAGFYPLFWLLPIAVLVAVAAVCFMGSFAYYVIIAGNRIALPDIYDPWPYILLAVIGIVFLVVQMVMSLKVTVAYRRCRAGGATPNGEVAHTGLAAALDARFYPRPQSATVYFLLIPSIVTLLLLGLAVELAPTVGSLMGIRLPHFAHTGSIGIGLILGGVVMGAVMMIAFLKRKTVHRGYEQALHMDENTPFSIPLEKYAHYQKVACEYRGLLWILPIALFALIIAICYVSSRADYLILLGSYRFALPDIPDPVPFIFLALVAAVSLVFLMLSSISATREFRRADAINRQRIREKMERERQEQERLEREQAAAEAAAAEAAAAEADDEEESGGLWGDYSVETEEAPAEETPSSEPESDSYDFGFFLDGSGYDEPAAETAQPEDELLNETCVPLAPLYKLAADTSDEPAATAVAAPRKAANLHELCEWFMQFARAHGYEPDLASARALLAAMATSRVVFVRTRDEASEDFAATLAKFFGSNAPVVGVRESWNTPKSLLFTGAHDARVASDSLCAMYRSGFDQDSFCTLTLTHAEQAPAAAYLTDVLAYAERPDRAFAVQLLDESARNLPANTVFCEETATRPGGVYLTLSPNVWCLVESSDSKSFWAPSAGYTTGAALTVSLRGKACEPVSEGDASAAGLSAEAFRRLLRGLTEKYFLPEEQWKKFDRIENFLHARAGVRFDNRLMRRLETFSSAYMAVDQDENQILDAMLEAVFLPMIAELDPASLRPIDGGIGICEIMALSFGADNIPYSMQALHELGYEA